MGHQAHSARDTRWGERITVRNAVAIQWEDRERSGTIHHLSVSGCFVETAFPYPAGATLRLSFLLDPGVPPVEINARVVMRNLGGIGLRFLYQEEDTPLRLRRWVDAHMPHRGALR
jgi:hypothetical protein